MSVFDILIKDMNPLKQKNPAIHLIAGIENV